MLNHLVTKSEVFGTQSLKLASADKNNNSSYNFAFYLFLTIDTVRVQGFGACDVMRVTLLCKVNVLMS